MDSLLTILLVEDEMFVREVTREILESAGYRVLVAGSAEEAQRIYDRHTAELDLLLTDVILPRENGREFATRAVRGNPQLQVLYVTGYPEQMVAAENEQSLAKPFSADALLERVRQLLETADFSNYEDEARRVCAAV